MSRTILYCGYQVCGARLTRDSTMTEPRHRQSLLYPKLSTPGGLHLTITYYTDLTLSSSLITPADSSNQGLDCSSSTMPAISRRHASGNFLLGITCMELTRACIGRWTASQWGSLASLSHISTHIPLMTDKMMTAFVSCVDDS